MWVQASTFRRELVGVGPGQYLLPGIRVSVGPNQYLQPRISQWVSKPVPIDRISQCWCKPILIARNQDQYGSKPVPIAWN